SGVSGRGCVMIHKNGDERTSIRTRSDGVGDDLPLTESSVPIVHGSGLVGQFPTRPGGGPPGAPASCQGRHRVLHTFEWSSGDPGDPAELVADYLATNGLPVRDIGRTATQVHPNGAGSICGAALYVSAAAGSVMAGGAPE